ncbi:unnamed protein product, partial [Coregonus sp. 'balchen']
MALGHAASEDAHRHVLEDSIGEDDSMSCNDGPALQFQPDSDEVIHGSNRKSLSTPSRRRGAETGAWRMRAPHLPLTHLFSRGNASLHLRGCGPRDRGKYKCHVRTSAGMPKPMSSSGGYEGEVLPCDTFPCPPRCLGKLTRPPPSHFDPKTRKLGDRQGMYEWGSRSRRLNSQPELTTLYLSILLWIQSGASRERDQWNEGERLTFLATPSTCLNLPLLEFHKNTTKRSHPQIRPPITAQFAQHPGRPSRNWMSSGFRSGERMRRQEASQWWIFAVVIAVLALALTGILGYLKMPMKRGLSESSPLTTGESLSTEYRERSFVSTTITLWSGLRGDGLGSGFHDIKALVPVVILLWTFTSTDGGDIHVTCLFSEDCVLACSFQPDIQISSNSRASVYRGRTALFNDQIPKGNASLLLRGLTLQDQGRYKCYTSTIKGNKESFINIAVEAPVRLVDIQVSILNLNSPGPLTPPSDLSFDPGTIQNSTSTKVDDRDLYDITSTKQFIRNRTNICNVTSGTVERTATLKQQGEVSIPCSVSQSDLLTFNLTWGFNQIDTILTSTYTKGTSQMYVNDQWKDQVQSLSDSGSLQLHKLTVVHQGIYSCELSTARDTHQVLTYLEITPDKPSDVSDGLSSGSITGITIAAVAAVIIAAVICYRQRGFLPKSKKVTRSSEEGESLSATDPVQGSPSSEVSIPCSVSQSDLLTFNLTWRFNQIDTILNSTYTKGTSQMYVDDQLKEHVQNMSDAGSLQLHKLTVVHQGIYSCELSTARDSHLVLTYLEITPDKPSDVSDGLSPGSITGITIAAVAAVIIAAVICYLLRANTNGQNENVESGISLQNGEEREEAIERQEQEQGTMILWNSRTGLSLKREEGSPSSEVSIPCSVSQSDLLTFNLTWRFNQIDTILNSTYTKGTSQMYVDDQLKEHVQNMSDAGSLQLHKLTVVHQGIYSCELSTARDSHLVLTYLEITPDKPSDVSDGLSPGSITGITIAAVAAVIIAAVICYLLR